MKAFRCLVVLTLCFAAFGCTLADQPIDGGVLQLEWSPIAVPANAERVSYECAVYEAEQGLPQRRVLHRTYLTETGLTSGPMPGREYVFAVRAHYWRDGREWVTRWGGGAGNGAALVPLRGLRRVVPKQASEAKGGSAGQPRS